MAREKRILFALLALAILACHVERAVFVAVVAPLGVESRSAAPLTRAAMSHAAFDATECGRIDGTIGILRVRGFTHFRSPFVNR